MMDDHELPRIWRFVKGPIPGQVACLVDQETNVVTIDKEIFDSLGKPDQDRLMRATADIRHD